STVNAFRAASAADYKFYVNEDAATSSSYSSVHVIVEGAKSLSSYSDAYTTKINEVKGNIEKIREEREKARAQELTVDTPASLDAAERQANMLFGIERNIDRMAEGSRSASSSGRVGPAPRRRQPAIRRCPRRHRSRRMYVVHPGPRQYRKLLERGSDSSSIEAIATVFPFIFFMSPCSSALPPLRAWSRRRAHAYWPVQGARLFTWAYSVQIRGLLAVSVSDRQRARQHHRIVGLPLFLLRCSTACSLPQMLLSYDIVSLV
ncbi:MAG: hypothetical protein ACLTXI_12505, partial [Collinsella sp.]